MYTPGRLPNQHLEGHRRKRKGGGQHGPFSGRVLDRRAVLDQHRISASGQERAPQFLRNPSQRTLLQCLSDPICKVDGTLCRGTWSCLSVKWMVSSAVSYLPAKWMVPSAMEFSKQQARNSLEPGLALPCPAPTQGLWQWLICSLPCHSFSRAACAGNISQLTPTARGGLPCRLLSCPAASSRE